MNKSRIAWFGLGILVVGAAITAGIMVGLNKVMPSSHKSSAHNDIQISRMKLLVMGLDEVGKNTDTIAAVDVDAASNTISVLSVPRDTRTDIEGHRTFRINAAYAWGGIDLAKSTVEKLIGDTFDHYVIVKLEGFAQVIDAMDGVDIDVEKDMDYVDRGQKLYIHLRKGNRHLTGETAIHYARFRHDARGDLGRVERQQKLLRAVLEKMLSPKMLPQLPQLMQVAKQNCDTDLSIPQLIALARQAKKAGDDGLKTAMLPGAPKMIHGGSFYIASLPEATEGIQAIVDAIVKANEPKPTAQPAAAISQSTAPKGGL
ncbi:MAG: LCP family protein [Armatimonadota bacterium]